MNSSQRYKDSFNDIGFITIIANAFRDLACTLNYNMTSTISGKRISLNCCITPPSNRHRSINAEKILNSENVATFYINFHYLTECLLELIADNENNITLFRMTQQNALNQLILEDRLREDVMKIFHVIITYCFKNTNKSDMGSGINIVDDISPEYLKLIELLQLRQYPAEFKIDILNEINELNIECDQTKNIFRDAGGYICILSLLSELGGIWTNKMTSPKKDDYYDSCLTPVTPSSRHALSNDQLSISSINDFINGSNQLDSINEYIRYSYVMKNMKIIDDSGSDNHISSFVLFQLILTSLIISLKNMPVNRRFFLNYFDKKSFSDLLYMTGIFGTEAGIIIYGYLFALLTEDLSIVEIFSIEDQKLNIQDNDDESSEDDKPMLMKAKSDFFDNWNDKGVKKKDKNNYNTFRYYRFPSLSSPMIRYCSIPQENFKKLSKLKFINSYGIPVVLDILQNSMEPNTALTILEIVTILLNSYKYNKIMAYKTQSLLTTMLHLLYSSDNKSKYPLKLLKFLLPSNNRDKLENPDDLDLWDKCFENIHSLVKHIIEIGIEDHDSLYLLEKYNEVSLKCEKYMNENNCENKELQDVKSSILDLMNHALSIKHNFSYIHFDLTFDQNSYIHLKNISDGLFPSNNGYSLILNFRICKFNTNKTLNIVDIVDTRSNNSIFSLSLNNNNNNLKKLFIKTNKTQTCIDNLILMENKWYELVIIHQPNKYLRTLSFSGSSLNIYINGELYDNIKNEYIDAPISTQYLKCNIGEVVNTPNKNENKNIEEEPQFDIKWDFGVCYLVNYALDTALVLKIFLPSVDIQSIKFTEDKTLISLCSKNVMDNISEFKDEKEGQNKYCRLILNNTKSLNGLTYKKLASINDNNSSQFGVIKGTFTEYNPNLFSNSIWRFGGMSILLKIMENENVNLKKFFNL